MERNFQVTGSKLLLQTMESNIQIAGGAGIGYEFSIKVKKVDENGAPLKGAKFQVIRETNQDTHR